MEINRNFLFGIAVTIFVVVLLTSMGYTPTWETIIFIFAVSYPWTIGKNVYSLWGGFSEKESVYSLIGIIQVAGEDALQISGFSLYQKAGRDAAQIFGFSLYQKAGGDAVQGFGLSLYQKAEDTLQIFGFSLYQKAERDAVQSVGLSLCQKAGGDVTQFAGLAFYQDAKLVVKRVCSISIITREKSPQ